MNHYKKVLFPIHIFQTNIRENGLILDDALDKIEREAYENGNILFRNWEDSIKNQ